MTFKIFLSSNHNFQLWYMYVVTYHVYLPIESLKQTITAQFCLQLIFVYNSFLFIQRTTSILIQTNWHHGYRKFPLHTMVAVRRYVTTCSCDVIIFGCLKKKDKVTMLHTYKWLATLTKCLFTSKNQQLFTICIASQNGLYSKHHEFLLILFASTSQNVMY